MWCIHNAIEFEKKGVLSATVCTSGFASLVKATAQTNGFPSLAVVSVPHPIGGLPVEEIRKKADDVIEDMIRLLTQSS